MGMGHENPGAPGYLQDCSTLPCKNSERNICTKGAKKNKLVLFLARALTPQLGPAKVEGTISLSHLYQNNLITEKNIRPGPLRDQKRLDCLHLSKLHIYF